MAWYGFVLQLLCGMLITNGVPHLVQGLSGEPFQSPFGTPHGVGESSPFSNMLWGFANLALGAFVFSRFGPSSARDVRGWLIFAAGCLLIGSFCSIHFGRVRAAARASGK